MATANLAGFDRETELRRLRTLYELMAALTGARALEDIYQAAISSLLRATSADRASLLLFDEDGVMRFKAWSDLSAGYRAAVTGYSTWKQGQRDAKPVVIADVAAEPDLARFHEVFERERIRS